MLGLAALASLGLIGRSNPPTSSDEERESFSERYGNRLFLPALIIPAIAFVGTLLYTYTPLKESGLFEAKRETYVLLVPRGADRPGGDLRLAEAAGRWRRCRKGAG